MESEWTRTAETARRLGIHPRTLLNLKRAGELAGCWYRGGVGRTRTAALFFDAEAVRRRLVQREIP